MHQDTLTNCNPESTKLLLSPSAPRATTLPLWQETQNYPDHHYNVDLLFSDYLHS